MTLKLGSALKTSSLLFDYYTLRILLRQSKIFCVSHDWKLPIADTKRILFHITSSYDASRVGKPCNVSTQNLKTLHITDLTGEEFQVNT